MLVDGMYMSLSGQKVTPSPFSLVNEGFIYRTPLSGITLGAKFKL